MSMLSCAMRERKRTCEKVRSVEEWRSLKKTTALTNLQIGGKSSEENRKSREDGTSWWRS